MFSNYLKSSFRNLWKHRAFSLLNISGLAIGIASAALIFLWVEDENNYNHQFEKKDLLYRVSENQVNDGKITTSFGTPGPLAQAMRTEIPGIKNAGRLSWGMDQMIAQGDKAVKDYGVYADPSVLSMLTLKFVHGPAGDPSAVSPKPSSNWRHRQTPP